ncbi:hypothetical protein BABINDRAFT_160743 [Babjeviella inositovora NRRL Y-12698]|uniref:Sugar phosphate transporter domain-containing protein n=1 Tax=Babjeviella inositovora NRRL Y-12698 TaxID=984486 RepID=A0A1E3QUP2_9ASCO|nr:uncharacterized protein BABINDRAFT_160743 [Babjeviella inositovora NRRL Y-12698]ODQ81406.1 hypothetical protein BABINDRAFT_160743 [Babjeviella inositovora NRRL Y-12698]
MITIQETKRRSLSISLQAPFAKQSHGRTLLDTPFFVDPPRGATSSTHSRSGRIFLSTKMLSPIQSSTNLQGMARPRSLSNAYASRNSLGAKLRALMPPVDVKVVTLCLFWYFCSAISNNSTKIILKNFTFPVTLTEAQFLINSLLCLVVISLCASAPRLVPLFPMGTLPPSLTTPKALVPLIFEFITPTQLIISTTLPMGMFQFVGHISSHKATSMIPVSLVHTIKSLSPLTTVLIYRFMFKKPYKTVTYLTLLPLVCGVMMTCMKKKEGVTDEEEYFYTGIFYAFVSMLIFVSQNIFAKNILTLRKTDPLSLSANPTMAKKDQDVKVTDNNNKKLDKLTILFYCSVLGFSLTFPFYAYSELFSNQLCSLRALSPFIVWMMVLNGMAHFVQSLIAFHLLGLITPVNYSVANICKRIVVITVAVAIEGKKMGVLQSSGLGLTIVGLYCYDRWGSGKH